MYASTLAYDTFVKKNSSINILQLFNNFRSWVVVWPEDGPDKGPKHADNLTSKKFCVLT